MPYNIYVMVHPMNHIWRISNWHCALSMSWFILWTIFSKLVIYIVILLWFCWTLYAPVGDTIAQRHATVSIRTNVIQILNISMIPVNVYLTQYSKCNKQERMWSSQLYGRQLQVSTKCYTSLNLMEQLLLQGAP